MIDLSFRNIGGQFPMVCPCNVCMAMITTTTNMFEYKSALAATAPHVLSTYLCFAVLSAYSPFWFCHASITHNLGQMYFVVLVPDYKGHQLNVVECAGDVQFGWKLSLGISDTCFALRFVLFNYRQTVHLLLVCLTRQERQPICDGS